MGRGKIYPQLLLGTHTHSVSMSLGLPRIRLATTENLIIPRLVPPSPLVLLFMVGTWELLYQGPQYPWKCHTAILSDTFREHVVHHPFFFPVSVLSFPWALLTHKVSALTAPLLLLDPLHPHFNELSYLCFPPCRKPLRQRNTGCL